MPLTKRQVQKAARLYGLAMAAHADAGGAETDEEQQLMPASQAVAEAALARQGYDKAWLVTVRDGIALAQDEGSRVASGVVS